MDIKLRNMTAIYILKDNKILMLYRQGGRVVNNVYVGTAGGHFEPEEVNNPRACVLRELKEECGLSEEEIKNLTLRYATKRLKDGEIRQNYYFFADWNAGDKELTSDEGRLEWHDIDKVCELEMPLSAKYMMEHYVKIGRYTTALYAGITTTKGMTFVEMEDL